MRKLKPEISLIIMLHYLQGAVALDADKPVLVDKYIRGKEVEVDAICDGRDVFMPGVMELVERTGIHSGDSISVYPSFSISNRVKGIILRSSRTVPFLSKATGYPLTDIATEVILGKSLKEQGFFDLYPEEKKRYYVKVPVFSFGKIRGRTPI